MKAQYTQVLPPEWQPMSQVFTALGEEHRQRILLLFEKDEELNVSQIAAVSTLSRPTVSHHLKILRQADILLAECSRLCTGPALGYPCHRVFFYPFMLIILNV